MTNRTDKSEDNITLVDIENFVLGREHVTVENLDKQSVSTSTAYRFCKRLMDICGSLGALTLLGVPMLLITLLLMRETHGSPIYSQVRLGLNEKPFRIYKFRTMRMNAEEQGPRWAIENDERTTEIGRHLRNSRMDELPQLFNILLGQMSFVGPRPERPEFYDAFDTYITGFRQRMMVKPGLTGLAQVNGGYDLLPEEKILYDIEYMKNQSIRMDLICILKTVSVVLGHHGAR